MVTDIELTAQNGFEREITAEQIGELVMERLKRLMKFHMFVLPRFIANSRILIHLWRS